MKDLDVTVVGNIGIDTNIYLFGQEIDFSVEANFTENIDYIGQAGGFTARGFARLGYRTAFIGTVGNDANGAWIRSTLKADSIDTSCLWIDPAGTGRSINFMYPDGRRKNFYDGKGHMTFAPDLPACKTLLDRSKLVHFNIPNWARYLLPIAKVAGCTIACDLQDVIDPLDGYRQDFILSSDILFFSAANHPDPTNIIKLYLDMGAKVVVCGMGAQGCAVGTFDGIAHYSPPSINTAIVDTNGAGDGLATGFLASHILEGTSIERAALIGQLNARHTCTLRANTDNLADWDNLHAYESML